MANSKFYLKDKKSNKETIILLYFNFNNNVLKYSSKISIKPNIWNDKTCRVKHQSQQSLEINKHLQRIEDSILDIYHKLITNNKLINKKILKSELDIVLERDMKQDFFAYMKLYINQKHELKLSTKRDYNQTFNVLREFEAFSGYLVSFDSINLDFYNRFKDYILNSLNQSINTFGKRVKTVISVMNYATDIGVNKNLEYQKKAFKVLSKKVNRIYLTVEEIEKLQNVNLKCSKLDKIRNIFLLMCYLGIRFSDYNKISKNNINDNYLDIRMHKTNEQVSIPIHPLALQIILKYEYVLPKFSNQELNKQIKNICKIAEINEQINIDNKTFSKYELITCHTARRTFATNGYLSDVPVRDLMRITGHKKESTFLNYVQVKREVKLSRILEIYPAKLNKAV